MPLDRWTVSNKHTSCHVNIQFKPNFLEAAHSEFATLALFHILSPSFFFHLYQLLKIRLFPKSSVYSPTLLLPNLCPSHPIHSTSISTLMIFLSHHRLLQSYIHPAILPPAIPRSPSHLHIQNLQSTPPHIDSRPIPATRLLLVAHTSR